VEPVLLFIEGWWWIAPAAAGAGAAGYTAMTTNRRRARRLELDAARHEERTAYRELQSAKAEVRAAKGALLAMKASPGASLPALAEARRRFARAREAERSSSLTLRASRSWLKATDLRYHSTPRDAPLPIAALVARHDAVTARWLAYETDAATALSFPQMLDPQHPATLAFLRAQRDAQTLRAAATQGRVSPQTYLAYRNAVQDAESTFAAAEADARGEVREGGAPALPWVSLAPLAEWIPRAADALGQAAQVIAEVRAAVPAKRNGTAPRRDSRA
jgi:hypothetical protein